MGRRVEFAGALHKRQSGNFEVRHSRSGECPGLFPLDQAVNAKIAGRVEVADYSIVSEAGDGNIREIVAQVIPGRRARDGIVGYFEYVSRRLGRSSVKSTVGYPGAVAIVSIYNNAGDESFRTVGCQPIEPREDYRGFRLRIRILADEDAPRRRGSPQRRGIMRCPSQRGHINTLAAGAV